MMHITEESPTSKQLSMLECECISITLNKGQPNPAHTMTHQPDMKCKLNQSTFIRPVIYQYPML